MEQLGRSDLAWQNEDLSWKQPEYYGSWDDLNTKQWGLNFPKMWLNHIISHRDCVRCVRHNRAVDWAQRASIFFSACTFGSSPDGRKSIFHHLLRFPESWGYPQFSSISRWDFPWNKPSSYWGTRMTSWKPLSLGMWTNSSHDWQIPRVWITLNTYVMCS